ncbi:hypothetical protein GGI42DRAFT_347252 [Trichoderma sp. SZMC 28013]
MSNTDLNALGLAIEPSAGILICSYDECKHALSVRASHVTTHLWEKHKVPLEARKNLPKVLKTLHLQNPDQAPPRNDGSPEHPLLQVYEGFACSGCRFRSLNLRLTKQHYTNPLPAGQSCPYNSHETQRNSNHNIDNFIQYVYLQTWATGSARQYWTIKRDGSLFRPIGGQATQDHLKSVQQREHERNHNRGSRNLMATHDATTSSHLTFAEQRPWLERTGWEDTYRGRDRKLLSSLIEMPFHLPQTQPFTLAQGSMVGLDHDIISPASDEKKIAALLKLVDVMMDRCEETVKQTSRNILCWLKSTRLLSTYPKPFSLVRQPSSTKKYRLLFKKALLLVFRAYRMSPSVREKLIGIRLRKRLVDSLDLIWNHASWLLDEAKVGDMDDYDNIEGVHRQGPTFMEDEGKVSDLELDTEDTEEVSGEDVDGGEDEDDNTDSYYSEDTGDEMEEMDNNNTNNERSGGAYDTFENDANGSNELQELLFGLSLALCNERPIDGQPSSILLVYFSGILGFSTSSRTFLSARSFTPYLSGLIYIQRLLFLEQALPLRAYLTLGIDCRPRTRQLERLQAMRKKYMIAGSQSAFDEFFGLRSYGRIMARSDTPAFLLRWSEDGRTVHYGDHFQLSMGQFRLLPDYVIEQARRLCNELMFGLEPVVDLSNIKDELTNSQKGFSFVTNPQNNLREAYLDLLQQAYVIPQKESLSQRGRWNWQAVFKYFKKEEAFRGLLGLAIHITGGQTPRWSELLSLWCENAELGERGIYVYGGKMIYLMRHHKAKRSTNREFIVVRFLPGEVGHLLYKYLVYIRRFVNMLERERGFGVQNMAENSPLLFRSQNAPTSKPWPTGRFNAILKDATLKVWGHAINSRLLRQLCIGITEKHDANRNVVFAWQSGHRPLQRGVTYGLDGAFPTRLQPQLLELYEWASTRWHEFLHLPSKITSTGSHQAQPHNHLGTIYANR